MKQVLEDTSISGGFAVRSLTEGQATRRQILKELSEIANQAGPGDTVLFHFSGHGMRQGDEFYLVPVDAEASMDNLGFRGVRTGP
jgi:uncharacterized caspase-like protein